MPPKVKTSKEDVIKAALKVAEKEGVAAISAKSVSSQLGTSVAPIFRVFATIEELRNETVSQIYAQYIAYLKDYPFERSKFFTYGLAYIQFAKEYPNLFNALMEWGFLRQMPLGKKYPTNSDLLRTV